MLSVRILTTKRSFTSCFCLCTTSFPRPSKKRHPKPNNKKPFAVRHHEPKRRAFQYGVVCSAGLRPASAPASTMSPYETHYAQTRVSRCGRLRSVYCLMELHYSQTLGRRLSRYSRFYYLMELHYSQTSNLKSRGGEEYTAPTTQRRATP